MRYLRTNTATRVGVGTFVSATDGVTPQLALTVTTCKLSMIVDSGGVPTLVLDAFATASGGNNDMVHITGDDGGWYDLELTAANTNYLGRATLSITDATNHAPVQHEFMIIPAMMYDAMVLGTDRLDANVTHVNDTAQTAGDLAVLLATVAGYVDTEVLPASIRAAVGLATANLDTQFTAVPTANANADALLDRANGVETGLTFRQWLRLGGSVLFGKASGLATNTPVYRDYPDTKPRVSAVTDAFGNRTVVTRDAT